MSDCGGVCVSDRGFAADLIFRKMGGRIAAPFGYAQGRLEVVPFHEVRDESGFPFDCGCVKGKSKCNRRSFDSSRRAGTSSG